MQRSDAAAVGAMPSMVLRISNIISYSVFILINALANQGVFGPSNAEVSQKFHTPLTPAGWAFSIWGVIFALQGAGVVYAALPFGYDSPAKRVAVNTIGYGWQLTWLFECLWLVIFPRQSMVAFVFCAIFLFAGLTAITLTLARVYRLAPGTTRGRTGSTVAAARLSTFIDTPTKRGLLYGIYFLPTSINTAWLSVASCLGVTVLAKAHGVLNASGQNLLAASLAAVVTAVGVWILLQHGDLAYSATLIWALSAVLSVHTGIVEQLSVIAIGVLVLISAMAMYKNWQLRQQQQQTTSRVDDAAAAASLQQSLLGAAATGGAAGMGPAPTIGSTTVVTAAPGGSI